MKAGFLGKVRGVTGIGLNANESYRRAFEKGVLLGDYQAAGDLFARAAAKYEEAGLSEEAHRARANQCLYSFVASKQLRDIGEVARHLDAIGEIEELGSEITTVPAIELKTELEARQLENAAFASTADPGLAVQLHSDAAVKFQQIINAPLRTYKYIPARDQHETVEERYFLHQGYAFYYQGLMIQDGDPVAAAEKISQSALAFKRAKDDGLRNRMDKEVNSLRIKRECWFCHREMQGYGLNIKYYPARTTEYGRDMVRRLGKDAACIGDSGQSVAVCLPCASMIQYEAQRHVAVLRAEVEAQVSNLVTMMNVLAERLKRVESPPNRP